MIKRILPILLVLTLALISQGCGGTSGGTGSSSPKWNEDGYTSLGGASLGQTEEEVKSILGVPDEVSSVAGYTRYKYCGGEDCYYDSGILWSFFGSDGQVSAIQFSGGQDISRWECPNIAGIRPGDETEKITETLGPPEEILEIEETPVDWLYPSKNCFFDILTSFTAICIADSGFFEMLREAAEDYEGSAGLGLQPSICTKLR